MSETVAGKSEGKGRGACCIKVPNSVLFVLLALSILLAALSFAVRYHRGHGTILPMVDHAIASSEIVEFSGKTYRAKLPFSYADSNSNGYEAYFLQDGVTFSTAVKAPAQIDDEDGARHVFWDSYVYFSTPDGSNPLRNGRAYSVRWPMPIPNSVAHLLYMLTILSAFLFTLALWFSPIDKVERMGITGRCSIYLAFFIAGYVLLALVYAPANKYEAPGLSRPFPERVEYYRKNSNAFDLVFLGDSRSFCGIHPDIIDAVLPVKSINLSSFSNWFPTQYAIMKDIVDDIPSETTVVWSLGHINFNHGLIQRVYPVSVPLAFELVRMGFSPLELIDVVAWSLPISPVLKLFEERSIIRSRLVDVMNIYPSAIKEKQIGSIPAGYDPGMIAPEDTARVEALKKEYGRVPGVQRVDVIADNGNINSVVLIREGGTYYRIELESAYFRKKQMENARAALIESTESWKPDPRYMKLFEEMLDLMHDKGINLVVNFMEEAPHVYKTAKQYKEFNSFMDSTVKPMIEARGFPVIKADYNVLKDEDYFDYNHFNSSGVKKYTPMLIERLSPLLHSSKQN